MTPELRGQIEGMVLRGLRQRDGVEAREELLLSIIVGTCGPDVTRADAKQLLSDMADKDLLALDVHPVLKTRSYTLTNAGRHAAKTV
jgi:hypothetical protein